MIRSSKRLGELLESLANILQPLSDPLIRAAQFLLGRTRISALFRLFLAITVIALYWFVIVLLADFPGEVPSEWESSLGPFVYFLLNLVYPFFQPEVLVHLLPLIAAIFIGLFTAGLYLTDLFELESIWIAVRYLLGALIGLDYPILRIDHGDVQDLEVENSSNPLVRIGGPGHVKVHLGFAAVFETESGEIRVRSSRKEDVDSGGQSPPRLSSLLDGFERLRDVVDLRDRHSKLDEVRAVTRDGIEVYARDAQMVFRVFSGGQERNLTDPYPFDQSGIRRLVYGQPASQKGQQKWEGILPLIVQKEIRDFVARREVEDFLALQPNRLLELDREPESDTLSEDQEPLPPRRDLIESFHTDARQSRLREQGLELAWVGVGAWEVRDEETEKASREAGPGKTLMTAWRDLQRTRRLRSQSYLERTKEQSFKDRTARTINNLIWTWKNHQLRPGDRCYEVLNRLRQDLVQLRISMESSAELEAKYQAILDHLDELIGPVTMGGSGA
jgi:hypothetical protein